MGAGLLERVPRQWRTQANDRSILLKTSGDHGKVSILGNQDKDLNAGRMGDRFRFHCQ